MSWKEGEGKGKEEGGRKGEEGEGGKWMKTETEED